MTPDGAFRIGLLGHGTVGPAFAELLEDRAGAIESEVGLRPEISGVLTRGRGEFGDILERSDLIVELLGGLEPTRDYVLRALAAGRARPGQRRRAPGRQATPPRAPPPGRSRAR